MTHQDRSTDNDWLNSSPYPGARPLGSESGDKDILLGRASDVDRFVALVSSYQVIELTAASGVGKSSLLGAGLVPELRAQGAEVGLLRDWSRVAGDDDDAYYADAVRSALLSEDIDCGGLSGTELIPFLVEEYGSALVLIFDQLEELFRDDPRLGRRFLGSIKRAAESLPFHQVLSLRSEFKAELSALEEGLSQTLWRPFPLRPVEDETVGDVVRRPAKAVDIEYDDEAVTAIKTWWSTARAGDWQIGLLHLQALLWVLFLKVRPSPGQVLSTADLQAGWPELPQDDAPVSEADAMTLFELALREFVALRLGSAEDADDVFARERLFAAARIAPELSSEGYKLIRDATELAVKALPEVENLGIHASFWTDANKAGRAWHGSKGEFPSQGDIEEALLARGWSPDNVGQSREDPTQPSGPGNASRTAGRLYDALPFQVVSAAIAALEGALRQLEDRWIVRITPTQRGQTRVALVHDGFGRALDAWSAAVLEDVLAPIESLTRLTATDIFIGKTIRRAEIPRINNVRWVGCYVEADFEGVTFTRSELDGTWFQSCRFSDVIFEDCQLWGTLFVDCTFGGKEGTAVVGPRQPDGLQSLTFRGCRIENGGLHLVGQNGYGLFLKGCEGGPWSIEESTLTHVNIDGAENGLAGGTVLDCPAVDFVSVTGNLLAKPTYQSSNLLHFEPDHWEAR